MRKRIAVIIAFALAAATGHWAVPVQAGNASRFEKPDLTKLNVDYVPGEVLVEFRPGVSKQRMTGVSENKGAKSMHRVGRTAVRLVKLEQGTTVSQAVAAFNSSPLVRTAEPNLIRRPTFIPDDTNFGDLWGLNNTGQAHPIANPPPATAAGTADADIDAPEAWDTQQGAPTTVIAVLDTGIDVTHPDLNGSLWVNAGEIPGNAFDDDGNGYVDDVNGFDFADNDNTLLHNDPSIVGWDHGTHVSGTIAAEINNATGVAGVCPGCRIMTLKGFKPIQGAMGLTLADEIEALDYAAAMGAHVLNGSYGSSIITSKLQRRAFVNLGKAGVLAVVAAGNENGDNDMLAQFFFNQDNEPDFVAPAYPASYNVGTILSVAASNHNDELAYDTRCAIDRGSKGWPCTFTSWGHDSVDLAGPGVDILSTIPGGGYETFEGTSMAAPHVTGVAGLVKSANPTYTPNQLKNAVMNSVDEAANLNTLRAFPNITDHGEFLRTDGRLNALTALTAPTTNSFPTTDGNINGAKRIAGSKSGRVDWPEDVNDVYKKRLVKGRRYRAKLTVPGNRDFDLFAYKPGTKDIWQVVPSCPIFDPPVPGACQMLFFKSSGELGRDEAKTFKVTKTGTYFIQVSAFLTTGDYKLTIKRP